MGVENVLKNKVENVFIVLESSWIIGTYIVIWITKLLIRSVVNTYYKIVK